MEGKWGNDSTTIVVYQMEDEKEGYDRTKREPEAIVPQPSTWQYSNLYIRLS